MLWNIITVMGVTLVILGVSYGVEEFLWLRKAQFASGVVVEFGGSGEGYAPRVQYLANDGSEHEFTRSYQTNRMQFTLGEVVPVAYDPVTYKGRILTFGQRFGLASIFTVLGTCLLTMALALAKGDQIIAGLCLQ